MAKITEQDKAEIIKQYACGRSAREIAKSLHVSHTAISKILNEIKSCQEEKKVATTVAKQDNRAIAKFFEDKVMLSLERDIDKTSPLDRIKIVERLRFLYGDNDSEKSKLQEVVESMKNKTLLNSYFADVKGLRG